MGPSPPVRSREPYLVASTDLVREVGPGVCGGLLDDVWPVPLPRRDPFGTGGVHGVFRNDGTTVLSGPVRRCQVGPGGAPAVPVLKQEKL